MFPVSSWGSCLTQQNSGLNCQKVHSSKTRNAAGEVVGSSLLPPATREERGVHSRRWRCSDSSNMNHLLLGACLQRRNKYLVFISEICCMHQLAMSVEVLDGVEREELTRGWAAAGNRKLPSVGAESIRCLPGSAAERSEPFLHLGLVTIHNVPDVS